MTYVELDIFEELIRFQLLAGRCVLIASHDRALVDRLAHARLQLAPLVRGGSEASPSAPGAKIA